MGQPSFDLCVQTHFSAAHHLRGYQGDCANPHGHNWGVAVHFVSEKLNDIGIAFDFRDLKALVKTVLNDLDHTDLNSLPAFAQQNPSSELIAQYIFRNVQAHASRSSMRVTKVILQETSSYSV